MTIQAKPKGILGHTGRAIVGLALFGSVLAAAWVQPAAARDWHRDSHRHYYHRAPARVYAAPPVAYSAPRAYYAPSPPVVYSPQPSISFGINLR